MSMREKLAWAKEHGVSPPDYVLLMAAEEDGPGSCCEHPENQVAACCSARDGGSCRMKGKRAKCSTGSDEENAAADGVDWVLGIHAQKCQGLALHWITSGAIAPPPLPVELPIDTNPPLWCEPASPLLWQGLSQLPEVPPPRLS